MIYIFIPHVPAEPIGGVQTLFDYAERLNELAQTTVARIVCPAPYIRSILPRTYSLVPVSTRQPKLTASDVLVFPEVLANTLNQYPSENKKYLAVLNYGYFELYARKLSGLSTQISGFITNSQFTAQQLRQKYSTKPITYVPHVIEPRFHVSSSFKKRDQYSILVLNRKNTHHIPAILRFLESLPHKVTVVNNLSSDDLVALYNRHQIFINLGYPEGFCRPAAEAMAAGCVVVGFTGGGGGDFMKHGINSFVAPDGDEKTLLELLSHVLHTLGPEDLHTVSVNAKQTIASTYTKVAQAKKLYQVFRKNIPQSFTTTEIERHYKSVRNKPVVMAKRKPLFTTVSKQTLELQLFNERQKYAELTSSKFYSIWQKYCQVRDSIKQTALSNLRFRRG